MEKTTLLKTLTESRVAWEALLAQIDEEQMHRPGEASTWSVKDVIAHVTWGESELAPVLRTNVLAGSDLWNLSDDERNEITYQQNKEFQAQKLNSSTMPTYERTKQTVNQSLFVSIRLKSLALLL